MLGPYLGEQGSVLQRISGALRTIWRMPEVRAILQFGQFTASFLFGESLFPCLLQSWRVAPVILALCFSCMRSDPTCVHQTKTLNATVFLCAVVLYVWSTYSTPAPFSIRYNLDLMLCVLFATEFLFRLAVRPSSFGDMPFYRPAETTAQNPALPQSENFYRSSTAFVVPHTQLNVMHRTRKVSL